MRKLLLILSLLLFLPLLALAPRSAGAQGEADCEKHVEALAYNACLAALGPLVGERSLGERSLGERRLGERSLGEGRGSTVEQRRPGNSVQRRSDGRKAATFDVITGRK